MYLFGRACVAGGMASCVLSEKKSRCKYTCESYPLFGDAVQSAAISVSCTIADITNCWAMDKFR